MKRTISALAILLAACCAALAQSSPGLIQGQVPTAAQWNSYFSNKQDTLGYTALSKAGDTVLGRLKYVGSTPGVGSCGTNPSISGTDVAGEVTMGTNSPTGCSITFHTPYVTAPKCVVTWQSNLASMGYSVTVNAITLTQTAASSNKVNWHCVESQAQ